MDKQFEINHFVVEGEAAKRIYNIFSESHFVKSQNALGFNTQIEFDYADGILRIEERTDANSLVEDLLCFFVGCDNFYFLHEYSEDGVVQGCDTNDDEGKYFVRPPQTEWEREVEAAMDKASSEIPF